MTGNLLVNKVVRVVAALSGGNTSGFGSRDLESEVWDTIVLVDQQLVKLDDSARRIRVFGACVVRLGVGGKLQHAHPRPLEEGLEGQWGRHRDGILILIDGCLPYFARGYRKFDKITFFVFLNQCSGGRGPLLFVLLGRVGEDLLHQRPDDTARFALEWGAQTPLPWFSWPTLRLRFYPERQPGRGGTVREGSVCGGGRIRSAWECHGELCAVGADGVAECDSGECHES